MFNESLLRVMHGYYRIHDKYKYLELYQYNYDYGNKGPFKKWRYYVSKKALNMYENIKCRRFLLDLFANNNHDEISKMIISEYTFTKHSLSINENYNIMVNYKNKIINLKNPFIKPVMWPYKLYTMGFLKNLLIMRPVWIELSEEEELEICELYLLISVNKIELRDSLTKFNKRLIKYFEIVVCGSCVDIDCWVYRDIEDWISYDLD